ncbi:ABC transporter ATP-binding protein [bacterium]|nr:ABC transporter ATP-binding protein [bacterium]
MFPYIKTVLFRISLNIGISVPLGLLDGVVAISLRPYLDYVVNGNTEQTFTVCGHTYPLQHSLIMLIPVGIVVFALVQGILKYLSNYLTDWTGTKMANNLKKDLFLKLTSLDTKFFDVNSSGIILTRFLNDPNEATRQLIDATRSMLMTIFEIVALVFVLLFNSWKLAIIGVTVMGIAMIPVALIRKKIKQVSTDTAVVLGNMMTNLNETFSGNKIVTAYNLQEKQNKKFQGLLDSIFDLTLSLTKRVGWLSPVMYFVCSVGIALVMTYGNYLILSGQLTAGSFASFITALLLLYKPVKNFGYTLSELQRTFTAMSRVFELFDLTPTIVDKENANNLDGIKNDIEFKNVYFEYVSGTPVLKDISLKINKNETIALVGNSGGGKSTFVNLIPRFYDVTSGSIEIDGEDIRQFKIESLRNAVSFVFQDNFLFSGSLRENILMGNPNATDEEIKRALELAHLDEFVNTLPEGVDTIVGERGTSLSGGQRQRVAIARAMIKDAPVVILDEATSALDNESEAIVQKALDNLMKNRTVFVIAHRLSTIKNATRIVVINDGEIAEIGTHDELMSIENSRYKHLYEMQFAKQEK